MSDLWFFSFTVVHKWYAFFRNYALNFTVWCLTIASGQPCDCRGEQQIHSQPFFTPTTIRLFTFSMVACSVTKSCLTRRLHGLYPARLLCPWNSRGRNTGVGCHFLLQGIFPTQGSNPGFLPWQADSLPLSHLRSLWLSYCIWKLFPISPSKLRHAQLNCELPVSLWCFLKKKKKTNQKPKTKE